MNKRKYTYGIVVQHFDARNDIRDFIKYCSINRNIILYTSNNSKLFNDNYNNIRQIKTQKSILLYIFFQAIALFGKIPKSKNNFFITNLFKLSEVNKKNYYINLLKLKIRMLCNGIIDQEKLLYKMAKYDKSNIDGIDMFLFITEYSNIPFLARIIKENKKAITYIYSWDHPCKHQFIPKKMKYLVWNNDLKNDMEILQGIRKSKIQVIGATQLIYIKEYLKNKNIRIRIIKEKYFYFGCATGYEILARQEEEIIYLLGKAMMDIIPSYKLIVRPYPMFKRRDISPKLKKLANILIDDKFMNQRNDRSLQENDIYYKLNLQEHCDAFLHIGTTMGFEGTYLNCPVLFLNIKKFNSEIPETNTYHISKFIEQYHNEKYLNLKQYPNIITSTEDLKIKIKDVIINRKKYLEYNKVISSKVKLKTVSEIADKIFEIGDKII